MARNLNDSLTNLLRLSTKSSRIYQGFNFPALSRVVSHFALAGFFQTFPTKTFYQWNGYAFRWRKRTPLLVNPLLDFLHRLMQINSHWFYEDVVREQSPIFPSLPLKKFSEMLFHACPVLHQWSHDHERAFNTFMQYKTRVPVCGAIMLNETWEKVRHTRIVLLIS